MTDPIPQVGAPDPDKRNSPVLDADKEYAVDPDEEIGVCYFNGVAYPIGQYVRSGTELLHCEGRGIWVRRGEVRSAPGGGTLAE